MLQHWSYLLFKVSMLVNLFQAQIIHAKDSYAVAQHYQLPGLSLSILSVQNKHLKPCMYTNKLIRSTSNSRGTNTKKTQKNQQNNLKTHNTERSRLQISEDNKRKRHFKSSGFFFKVIKKKNGIDKEKLQISGTHTTHWEKRCKKPWGMSMHKRNRNQMRKRKDKKVTNFSTKIFPLGKNDTRNQFSTLV